MKPFVLVVMDGWGIRQSKKYNAVKLAKTPVFDQLWQENTYWISILYYAPGVVRT